MKIIVAGTIGRSGLGGQAWAVLQYLLGFRALGHDVLYLEDCGESSWVYNWDRNEWTTELEYPASYVQSCLEPFGLGDQWLYRTSEGSLGMPLSRFLEHCRSAELLIMRAVPLWVWRPEYDLPQRRAFIDVDPGFTQATLQSGDKGWLDGTARADRRFTYGQCVGRAGCLIPETGGPWTATLPPVFIDAWPDRSTDPGATHYTSVIRWQGFREVTVDGKVFGQRDKQFAQYLDLPSKSRARFRMALLGTEPSTLTSKGWEVLPGEQVSKTAASYAEFIRNSRGEISIPKHGYVAMRTGWVSDRSVCYLASGRPVLMEETGVSECLPAGSGLVTFRSVEEAVRMLEKVEAHYDVHARAARAAAESIFGTHVVLPDFLKAAFA
jgi:hypothetical protein